MLIITLILLFLALSQVGCAISMFLFDPIAGIAYTLLAITVDVYLCLSNGGEWD